LEDPNSECHEHLSKSFLQLLRQPTKESYYDLTIESSEIQSILVELIKEPNPLIQSVGLFILQKLDFNSAIECLNEVKINHPVFDQILHYLLSNRQRGNLHDFPLLEKVVYLYNSDFFQKMDYEILLTLAESSVIKTFGIEEHLLPSHSRNRRRG
jgi:hypothetical protein